MIQVAVIILGLLCLSAWGTLKAQHDLINLKDSFHNKGCAKVEKIYSESTRQEKAIEHWKENYQTQDIDITDINTWTLKDNIEKAQKRFDNVKNQSYIDFLGCFCDSKFQQMGNALLTEEFKSQGGTSRALCKEWLKDYWAVNSYKGFTSALILFVNYILRETSIKLIRRLQLTTVTSETTGIIVLVYLTTFINTAVLILLNGVFFMEHQQGMFTSSWFVSTSGTLVQTMGFAAVYPVFEFMIYWSIAKLKRLYDSGCGDPMKTRQTGVQKYVDLYSGPMYYIHFRYAQVLVFLSVAMIYGTGMPMLYPIALLGFVVLWFNERLLIVYYYKRPPNYNRLITTWPLAIMKKLPWVALPFNIWMLGNKKTFSNDIVDEHTILDLKTHASSTILEAFSQPFQHGIYAPNFAPFVLLCLIILNFLLKEAMQLLARGRDKHQKKKKALELEGNVDYFEAMNECTKKDLAGNELYYREHYDIKTMDDETLIKLQTKPTTRRKDRIIDDDPTYRLIELRDYRSKFLFYPRTAEPEAKAIQTQDFESQDSSHDNCFNTDSNNDLIYRIANVEFLTDEQLEKLCKDLKHQEDDGPSGEN